MHYRYHVESKTIAGISCILCICYIYNPLQAIDTICKHFQEYANKIVLRSLGKEFVHLMVQLSVG